MRWVVKSAVSLKVVKSAGCEHRLLYGDRQSTDTVQNIVLLQLQPNYNSPPTPSSRPSNPTSASACSHSVLLYMQEDQKTQYKLTLTLRLHRSHTHRTPFLHALTQFKIIKPYLCMLTPSSRLAIEPQFKPHLHAHTQFKAIEPHLCMLTQFKVRPP